MGKVITPSIAKLVRHKKIVEGDLHPISAQIVITNKCNLRCSFCTNKHGDRSSFLEADEVISILDYLKNYGCLGIEYTGGGEPTVHKNFSDLSLYAYNIGFDLGLVTNGTRLTNVPKYILKKYNWVRVSLNASESMYEKIHSVDNFDDVLNGLRLLDSLSLFFGVSYIYSGQGKEDVISLAKTLSSVWFRKNLAYLRIASDVLSNKPDKNLMKYILLEVESILKPFGIFVDYQVNRDFTVPNKCIMHKIKPCFDASGLVYPCCISQYGKFNEIGTLGDYKEVMAGNKKYNPDVKECPYCIYKEINDMALMFEMAEVKNPNFI